MPEPTRELSSGRRERRPEQAAVAWLGQQQRDQPKEIAWEERQKCCSDQARELPDHQGLEEGCSGPGRFRQSCHRNSHKTWRLVAEVRAIAEKVARLYDRTPLARVATETERQSSYEIALAVWTRFRQPDCGDSAESFRSARSVELEQPTIEQSKFTTDFWQHHLPRFCCC
jgi:hypothetical protein